MAQQSSIQEPLCSSRTSKFTAEEFVENLDSKSPGSLTRAQITTSETAPLGIRKTVSCDTSQAFDKAGYNKGDGMGPRISTPKLSLDVRSDKFFPSESPGIPANPHNTPASECEHASHHSPETSCHDGYRRGTAPAPKANKLTLNWLKNVSERSHVNGLVNNAGNVWKPPRPPKPLFLIEIGTSNAMGNVQSCATSGSVERCENPTSPPNPRFTRSSEPCRPCSRFVQILPRKQEHTTEERQRESWAKQKPLTRRRQHRAFPYRGSKNNFYVLLDDPDRPFPAPFPTIDKLPLHQSFDLHQLRVNNSYAQRTEREFSTSKLRQNASFKRVVGVTWGIIKSVAFWQKLGECTTISLELHKIQFNVQPLCLESKSYMLSTRISWSISSRCATTTNEQEPCSPSATPLDSTTRLFHVNLILPVLFLNTFSLIIAVIRHPVSSRIASVSTGFVYALLCLVQEYIMWTLKRLRENKALLQEKGSTPQKWTS